LEFLADFTNILNQRGIVNYSYLLFDPFTFIVAGEELD